MDAVQRVAGLEGHDLAPTQLAEIGAQLVRRVAAGAEVVMHRLLDAHNRATQIDLTRSVVQVVHRRMGQIVSTKHLFGFAGFVRHPVVGHGHGGEDHAFLIAQRDVLPFFKAGGEGFRHVQRDRHRPERAIGQAHVFHHAIVVFLGQEAFQRVETAIHQKLQIADLARGQIPAHQIGGFDFQLLGALIRDVKLGDGGQVALHDGCPMFERYKAAGCAGQFGM